MQLKRIKHLARKDFPEFTMCHKHKWRDGAFIVRRRRDANCTECLRLINEANKKKSLQESCK